MVGEREAVRWELGDATTPVPLNNNGNGGPQSNTQFQPQQQVIHLFKKKQLANNEKNIQQQQQFPGHNATSMDEYQYSMQNRWDDESNYGTG